MRDSSRARCCVLAVATLLPAATAQAGACPSSFGRPWIGPYGGRCSQPQPGTHWYSGDQALSHCRSSPHRYGQGADIAPLYSQQHAQSVAAELTTYALEAAWVGLRFASGSWSWVSDASNSYAVNDGAAWVGGAVPTPPDGNGCAVLRAADALLQPASCSGRSSSRHRVLCSVPACSEGSVSVRAQGGGYVCVPAGSAPAVTSVEVLSSTSLPDPRSRIPTACSSLFPPTWDVATNKMIAAVAGDRLRVVGTGFGQHPSITIGEALAGGLPCTGTAAGQPLQSCFEAVVPPGVFSPQATSFGISAIDKPLNQTLCMVSLTGRLDCANPSLPGAAPPAQQPADLPPLYSISVGGYHKCGIVDDGGVPVCWTSHPSGDFGGETVVPHDLPCPVASISAGLAHTCLVCGGHDSTVRGKVFCFGNRASGQIDVPAGTAPVSSISAGWYHSVGLEAGSGRVVGFGSNARSQLTPPLGLPPLVQLSAGWQGTCGLTAPSAPSTSSRPSVADGAAGGGTSGGSEPLCFGYGQAADSQLRRRGTLPSPALAVAAGSEWACALDAEGALACAAADETDAVQTATAAAMTSAASGGRYIALAAGHNHSCALRVPEARVECFGGPSIATPPLVRCPLQTAPLRVHNNDGAAGTTSEPLRFVQGRAGPTPLRFSANSSASDGSSYSPAWVQPLYWADLAMQRSNACARSHSGGVSCWGGAGYTSSALSSEAFAPLPSALSLAVGDSYACILDSSRAVSCFGQGTSWKAPPPGTPPSLSIGGGYTALCTASAGSGRVHCYGDAASGLSNSSSSNGAFKAATVAVSVGRTHACWLDSFGRVHCAAGRNDTNFCRFGQCVVPPDLPPAKALVSGQAHNCIIALDDSVRCWGVLSLATAGPIPGLRSIAAGEENVCLQRDDVGTLAQLDAAGLPGGSNGVNWAAKCIGVPAATFLFGAANVTSAADGSSGSSVRIAAIGAGSDTIVLSIEGSPRLQAFDCSAAAANGGSCNRSSVLLPTDPAVQAIEIERLGDSSGGSDGGAVFDFRRYGGALGPSEFSVPAFSLRIWWDAGASEPPLVQDCAPQFLSPTRIRCVSPLRLDGRHSTSWPLAMEFKEVGMDGPVTLRYLTIGAPFFNASLANVVRSLALPPLAGTDFPSVVGAQLASALWPQAAALNEELRPHIRFVRPGDRLQLFGRHFGPHPGLFTPPQWMHNTSALAAGDNATSFLPSCIHLSWWASLAAYHGSSSGGGGSSDGSCVCNGQEDWLGEGEVPLTSVLEWNSSYVSFVVPPGRGIREVQPCVLGRTPTQSDGLGPRSAGSLFLVYLPPKLTRLSPQSWPDTAADTHIAAVAQVAGYDSAAVGRISEAAALAVLPPLVNDSAIPGRLRFVQPLPLTSSAGLIASLPTARLLMRSTITALGCFTPDVIDLSSTTATDANGTDVNVASEAALPPLPTCGPGANSPPRPLHVMNASRASALAAAAASSSSTDGAADGSDRDALLTLLSGSGSLAGLQLLSNELALVPSAPIARAVRSVSWMCDIYDSGILIAASAGSAGARQTFTRPDPQLWTISPNPLLIGANQDDGSDVIVTLRGVGFRLAEEVANPLSGFPLDTIATPSVTIGGHDCPHAVAVDEGGGSIAVTCSFPADGRVPALRGHDVSLTMIGVSSVIDAGDAEAYTPFAVGCARGWHGLGGPGNPCQPCPTGAECAGFDYDSGFTAPPIALEGFYNLGASPDEMLACPGWRDAFLPPSFGNDSAPAFNVASCVVPCEPKEACLGANECADGYGSAAPSYRCAACAPGFYRSNGFCEACPGWSAAGIVASLCALTAMLAAGWWVRKHDFRTTPLFMLIDYAQVVSLLSSPRIGLPPMLQRLMLVMSFTSLNLDLVNPECVAAGSGLLPSVGLMQRLQFVTLLPPVLIACAIISFATLHWLRNKRKEARIRAGATAGSGSGGVGEVWGSDRDVNRSGSSGGGSGRSGSGSAKSHRTFSYSVYEGTMRMSLKGLELLYFPIMKTCLDVFNCAPTNPPDGNQYLFVSGDQLVPCGVPGGVQLAMVPYAALGVLLYGVGYPAFVSYLLWRYGPLMREDQYFLCAGMEDKDVKKTRPAVAAVRRRYGPLYEDYRPGPYRWWALVELGRKAAMTWVFLMFNKSAVLQVTSGALVMLAAAYAHSLTRPLLSPDDYAAELQHAQSDDDSIMAISRVIQPKPKGWKESVANYNTLEYSLFTASAATLGLIGLYSELASGGSEAAAYYPQATDLLTVAYIASTMLVFGHALFAIFVDARRIPLVVKHLLPVALGGKGGSFRDLTSVVPGMGSLNPLAKFGSRRRHTPAFSADSPVGASRAASAASESAGGSFSNAVGEAAAARSSSAGFAAATEFDKGIGGSGSGVRHRADKGGGKGSKSSIRVELDSGPANGSGNSGSSSSHGATAVARTPISPGASSTCSSNGAGFPVNKPPLASASLRVSTSASTPGAASSAGGGGVVDAAFSTSASSSSSSSGSNALYLPSPTTSGSGSSRSIAAGGGGAGYGEPSSLTPSSAGRRARLAKLAGSGASSGHMAAYQLQQAQPQQ